MKILKTPLGNISCVFYDNDYPAVSITVDGVPVVTLEYEHEKLRVFTFQSTLEEDDDPWITVLRTERDEVQNEKV